MDGLVKRAVSFGLSILCLMFSFSTPALAGDLFEVRANFGAVEVRLNDRVGYGKNYLNATFRILNGARYGELTTFGERRVTRSLSSGSPFFSPGAYAMTSFSACDTNPERCDVRRYGHTPVGVTFFGPVQWLYVENCLGLGITCEREWVKTNPRVVMTDTAQGKVYSMSQPVDEALRATAVTGDFDNPTMVAYNSLTSSMYVLEGSPSNIIFNCPVNETGNPDTSACREMPVTFTRLTDMTMAIGGITLYVVDAGNIKACPLDATGDFDHCDSLPAGAGAILSIEHLTFNNMNSELWGVQNLSELNPQKPSFLLCSIENDAVDSCTQRQADPSRGTPLSQRPGKPVTIGDFALIPDEGQVSLCRVQDIARYICEPISSLTFDKTVNSVSRAILPALETGNINFLISLQGIPAGYTSSLLNCAFDSAALSSENQPEATCTSLPLPTGETESTSITII
ncbi:MAG: hypothetical protein K0U37_05825 [Gammaproteobacteria bacterium]|nr:hypothetical protein [Gammaproteobacteria bacterium]